MADNKVKKNEKSEVESATVQGQMEQRVVQSPHLAFADSTLVMTSKYDVKIYFGVSMPAENGGSIQYHTILSMSPQLARALSNSLTKAVSDYERDYMPLKMNDEK